MEDTAAKRILLVDDSPFFLTRIRDLLTGSGYRTAECSRSRDAMDLLGREHATFSLVIIDLKMPEVDGFAFLRWLRKQPFGAAFKVLVLTGAYDLTEVFTPLRQLGVTGLMDKSSHPHHILTSVNAILATPSADKRHFQRLAVHLPVSLTFGTLRKDALVTILSPGGCFIVTDDSLRQDSGVEVNLALPDARRQLRLAARVAWRSGGEEGSRPSSGIRGFGVQWKDLTEADRRDLEDFVNQRRDKEGLLLSPVR